jgi:hypothetical protein
MQPTQDFSKRNLLWMRGRKLKSVNLKGVPPNREEWEALASQLEHAIADGTFRFSGIYSSSAIGKRILSTSDVRDALVLRKMNDNIRRSYGIKQPQRKEAIQLLKRALAEWTPKSIAAIDLKSCFETITPSLVLRKLRCDGRVSNQTISLLEMFFKQSQAFGANKYGRGLPRGILISSTLAELYLKELDERVSALPGVYVYIRYVDDIVTLATMDKEVLLREIEGFTESLGLRLNASKTVIKTGGCQCAFECCHKTKCPCRETCNCPVKDPKTKALPFNKDCYDDIDYLGYKLIYPTGAGLEKNFHTFTLISDRKSKKLRKRIAESVAAFRINRDISLFRDRLGYLTRNVVVDRTLKGSKLLSGVAFTYDEYCEVVSTTDAKPKKIKVPSRFDWYKFSSLDGFLQIKLKILFQQKLISAIDLARLRRNTFNGGHQRRHRISLDPSRITKIRKCWDEH